MGRGRAKAKQTKVARELKYYSPDTDLSALERELHQSSPTGSSTGSGSSSRSASADQWGDDDYEQWASGGGER